MLVHNLRMDNVLNAPVLLCVIYIKIHEAEVCCGAREYVFALSNTLSLFGVYRCLSFAPHIHCAIISMCMCVCVCLRLSDIKRENVFISF